MQLNEAERSLLAQHGIYVFEKCDNCHKPITNSLTWKLRNRKEIYCSQYCRDGVKRIAGNCQGCGLSLSGRRRGIRFCGPSCRMRFVRDSRKSGIGQNNANTPQ